MGTRRQAREVALQILFQIDLGNLDLARVLQDFWMQNPSSPEVEEFAGGLVEGVRENLEEIDQLIARHATHWKLSRMACVDRNILRIAIYELKFRPDIPSTVSIDEAIEIGKKFGTEDSGAFINGILDPFSKEIQKP